MGTRLMGLQAGGHLGIYEIVSLLGTGGMGEVYRARDTKLSREVALKVLPEAMAGDPQRLARFEREARTLASLNHSNIAAIYGLETSNGVTALVMELVEGETLEERIARSSNSRTSSSGSRKGLQPEDSLQIAKQITEALEYAHERGVVHRDLKPANVKITPEGAVKVLDFGLAKVLTGGDSSVSLDPSNSPTISAMATQMGIILGTAAYMAPEQAKGKPVDRRADIWAFGCVLYEMLTGKKAFEGETITDIIAAVVTKDPDWTLLPDTTPPAARRLLQRCLQKDPRQRLRDIGDVRLAIEETMSGADAGTEAYTGRATQAKPTSPLRRYLPWGVAAAFCVLSAILAFFYFRSGTPAAPTTRTLIMAPEKLQFGFSNPDGAPVLSPDGKRLVFPVTDQSGNSSLWVRPLNSLTAQQLQGTEDAQFPFWAPDSRQLGFFKDGKLEKIDVTGGPPVLVCDATNGRGGTWNRDGDIVFAPEIAGGLSSVPAGGGTPTVIIPAPKQTSAGVMSDRWPEFLPDGEHFLYLGGNNFSSKDKDLGIYVGKLGSKETQFLLQADSQALYAAPGYLLFLRGNTLMAHRFDAGSVKLKGEAFPVAENVPSPQNYRLGIFGVSGTGELVYATGGSDVGLGHLEWVDATGKELGKVGPAKAVLPRISPDGKRLAYIAGNAGNMYGDVWLVDLTRGVNTRFTFNSAEHYSPVWSPDGSRIVYGSTDPKFIGLLVKDASGAGKPEPLVKTNRTAFPDDWSRDGRYILYSALSTYKQNSWSLWVLPQFGDRKPLPYIQDQFNELWGVFSPDGRWVAYQSDASGHPEVYLSTFPAGGGKWQVSQNGGQFPMFSRDGRELYYEAPGGKMMEAVVTENGSTVEIGTPRQLFQLSTMSTNSTFDVAPDGKRFLVINTGQGESPPLTLVTNWTAGLKK